EVRRQRALLLGELGRHDLELRGELGERLLRFLHERPELLRLVLAVALQLAELLDLALRRVRLALVAGARELLTRFLDLGTHLSGLGDEVQTQLLHLLDASAIGCDSLLQLAPLGLQLFQRAAVLGELLVEPAQLGVDASKAFEAGDLIPDTQALGLLLVIWGVAHRKNGRCAKRTAGSGPTWIRTRNGPVMSRGL